MPDDSDAALRALLKLPAGARVFLAIGGVEKRKNTIAILEAFRIVHATASVGVPGDRRRRLAARP